MFWPFLLLAYTTPSFAGLVQKPNLRLPPDAQENADAVKRIFNDSYSAYREHAFGHDDLSPVSMGFSDDRNGWGATIADAMSTMVCALNDTFKLLLSISTGGNGLYCTIGRFNFYFMVLNSVKDYFNEALAFVSKVDFSKSNTSDNVRCASVFISC